jgi:N-acetylmuramoyl-L-alanine amidase
MGLRTGDIAALESEVGRANASAAQIFISIHVNGNNPSGVRGFCYPGDSGSFRYAQTLLKSVAAATGLTYRGVGETDGLYVLDPANNSARIRVLLELGDNVEDRAFLASREGRQQIASALAQAVAATSPGIH